MTVPTLTAQAPQSLIRPMRAVMRWGLLLGLAALLIASAVGYALAGTQGLWGAVLGVGICLGFFSLTVIVALVTARLDPKWLGAAVLATWLIKIVALMAILSYLRATDFYSRPVFFACLLTCTMCYLGLEAWIVMRTKVLYVETEFATGRTTSP